MSKHGVVERATNSATFDNIADGDPLENYREDGIIITTDTFAYEGVENAFTFGSKAYDLYYGYWWNTASWVTISMEDGSRINSLDFLIGDGFGYINKETTFLIWETFANGVSSGYGDEEVKRGSLVGWLDEAGFDSIRVAASYLKLSGFGDGKQAIAIDNVNISSLSHSVPEPVTLLLLATGFLFLAGVRQHVNNAR